MLLLYEVKAIAYSLVFMIASRVSGWMRIRSEPALPLGYAGYEVRSSYK